MIDLWGCDISRFVWFCAAGKPFFPGVSLLILAAVFPASQRVLWIKLLRYTLIVVGVVFVFLSATPINEWIYVIWAASFFTLVFVIVRPPRAAKKGYLPGMFFIFVCATALLMELPFHFSSKVSREGFEKLYVIGDSVSAGMGGKSERPWPAILGEKYGVDVTNLSVSGATVSSILPQADKINDNDAIVLFEIGGNDLLSMTPKLVFKQNLRFLLQKAVRPNRSVLMLELPLAPCHIGYGRIQRRLAAEFGIILVPKSFFADVLGTKGATIDLAHLSPKGSEIMADKVWSLLNQHLRVKKKQAYQ